MDADRPAHCILRSYPIYCLPGSAGEEGLTYYFAGCYSLFIKIFANKHPINMQILDDNREILGQLDSNSFDLEYIDSL